MMHLLRQERVSLDEQAQAEDLDHGPTDIVFLSFSDTDLSSFSNAISRQKQKQGENRAEFFPRCVSLTRLRHPLSVDLYIEKTISHARCVIIRLLGGVEYWRYGLEECLAACRKNAIPLVVISGEGKSDATLLAYNTVTEALQKQFADYFMHGGPNNMDIALTLSQHIARYGCQNGAIKFKKASPFPVCGFYPFSTHDSPAFTSGKPVVGIIFYRSHLLAGDHLPVDALIKHCQARGMDVFSCFVSSLKDITVRHFISSQLKRLKPDIVLNATFFTSRDETFHTSPLDAANCPIIQLFMPLNTQPVWKKSFRGLSQSDMAMQLVLPELDGRLAGRAISFKAEQQDFNINIPYLLGIQHVVEQAYKWCMLKTTPVAQRKIGIILSNYPGVNGQLGHAVGLDSFASLANILSTLKQEGYFLPSPLPDIQGLTNALCYSPLCSALSLDGYKRFFITLPASLQEKVLKHWGKAENEAKTGYFYLRFFQNGHITCLIQPDRNTPNTDRKAIYHDPDVPPCHTYLACYFWLLHIQGLHGIIQLGTHGNLEWLPGKAAALSELCFPQALLQGMPVIYPFIVNNAGEAACAKRRLNAVTIGHLTPPMQQADHYGAAAQLESMIDDYAEADGLDQRRMDILRADILQKAEAIGVLRESGVDRSVMEDDTALARLDAYLCDVKDLQIRIGLHIFGTPPTEPDLLLSAISKGNPKHTALIKPLLDASPAEEMRALISALNGGFIEPGPAGAPTRGRADVLPTGRNLYTVDPRGIPTQAAYRLAQTTAQALLERYMQEKGDFLYRLVMDVWASATLRTGGEDLAVAFVLMGIEPVWDPLSRRITGFDIIPLAHLSRPRVDITLRVSGLFRDSFENLLSLFEQAVKTLTMHDEGSEWNPYHRLSAPDRSAHIFSTEPGQYGVGGGDDTFSQHPSRTIMGQSWLSHSSYSYSSTADPQQDIQALTQRLKEADLFLHNQDHAETDILDHTDYASHEGGMQAAAHSLGNTEAPFYLADTSQPASPKIRLLSEEIRRVVRARAANPQWIQGMMKHTYRGAAEISRPVSVLYQFAALLPERFDDQFTLVFQATLGNDKVRFFLEKTNPEAFTTMKTVFADALKEGLWRPRQNSIIAFFSE